MRSVLHQATTTNARLTAAAIGGALVRVANERTGTDADVSERIEAVREATFALLTALSRGTGAGKARGAALQSLDDLELALSVPAGGAIAASAARTGNGAAAVTPVRSSWLRALIRRIVPEMSPGYAARHG